MERTSSTEQQSLTLYAQGHSVAQVEQHLQTGGLTPAQAQQVAHGTFRRYQAQRQRARRRAQQRAAVYLTLGSVFAVASGLLLALEYVFHGAWPGPAWACGAGLGLSLGAVGYGVRERRRAAAAARRCSLGRVPKTLAQPVIAG